MIKKMALIDLLVVMENPRDLDRVSMEGYADRSRDSTAAQLLQNSFASFAQVTDDFEPIGCAGFMEKWPGCIYCWAFATPAAAQLKHAKEWLRFLRKTMDNLLDSDCRRLECMVLVGFDGAAKTVESLGFVREGIEQNSGMNGESRYYYARLK